MQTPATLFGRRLRRFSIIGNPTENAIDIEPWFFGRFSAWTSENQALTQEKLAEANTLIIFLIGWIA